MGSSPLPTLTIMDFVLIIHSVRDYPAWKRIFDDAAAIRKKAGEQSFRVLVDEKDPNRVIHFSRWSSLAEARSFFESPELVEIRRQAGVDAPEFKYLHSVDAGEL
jgi:quinol monooxygenase YgiN